jgi:hypothetical protein
MYIIFGHQLPELPDNYTFLELDTFVDQKSQKSTAWCVLHSIPLMEFSNLGQWQDLHCNLMQQYRERNWDYCQDAIASLMGQWNGEMDSFYEILSQRINDFKTQELDSDWDGSVQIADLDSVYSMLRD